MPARPPRTPKGERWGGRAKGTPNKRTAEGQAIFTKLNFDCIEESIELFREWKTRALKGPLSQRRAYQDLMSQLLGRMTQYQYARLRSIEMKVETEDPDKHLTREQRKARTQALFLKLVSVMPEAEKLEIITLLQGGQNPVVSNGASGTLPAPQEP